MMGLGFQGYNLQATPTAQQNMMAQHQSFDQAAMFDPPESALNGMMVGLYQ